MKDSAMDTVSFNRDAWDRHVENGCEWTVPVTQEKVAEAREGRWQVILTATKYVPRSWFPANLLGANLLGLACGGGQQGPIFAAAGANVTIFDNSPRQLNQDKMVADRDGLAIRTVLGDMTDLSVFENESFDIIFHPVSNTYVEAVEPVWRECWRVLRRGGSLLAGFTQPHIYCLDLRDGVYHLRFPLPYSDRTSISSEERSERFGADTPYEFSHMFTAQLGGQLAAGFHLVDLYEDGDPRDPLSHFMPLYMATRAVKE